MDPDKDPWTYTIPQLKSVLSEAGVELPTSNQKKAVYVDLYEKAIEDSIKKSNKPARPPKRSTTPGPKDKRRRPTQKSTSSSRVWENSSEDEDEENAPANINTITPPKTKKRISMVKSTTPTRKSTRRSTRNSSKVVSKKSSSPKKTPTKKKTPSKGGKKKTPRKQIEEEEEDFSDESKELVTISDDEEDEEEEGDYFDDQDDEIAFKVKSPTKSTKKSKKVTKKSANTRKSSSSSTNEFQQQTPTKSIIRTPHAPKSGKKLTFASKVEESSNSSTKHSPHHEAYIGVGTIMVPGVGSNSSTPSYKKVHGNKISSGSGNKSAAEAVLPSPFVSDSIKYTRFGGPAFANSSKQIEDPGTKRWILLGLLVLVVGVLFTIDSTMPFCDTASKISAASPDVECRPCPPHGTCSAGQLHCDEGFKESSAMCVQDQEIVLAANQLGEKTNHILGDLAGEFHCGYTSSPKISEAALRSTLFELRIIPKDKFELAWKMAKSEVIFSRPNWKIHYVNEQGSAISTDSPKFTIKDPSSSKSELELRFFYSEDMNLPYLCSAQLWADDNLRELFIGAGLVAITIFYYRKRDIRRLRQQEVDKIVDNIQFHLQARYEEALSSGGSIEAEISVSHLRDEILPLNAPDRDLLWSLADARVQEDSRISSSMSLIHGEPHECYKWVAPLTPTSGRKSLSRLSSGSSNSAINDPSPSLSGRRLFDVDDNSTNRFSVGSSGSTGSNRRGRSSTGSSGSSNAFTSNTLYPTLS